MSLNPADPITEINLWIFVGYVGAYVTAVVGASVVSELYLRKKKLEVKEKREVDLITGILAGPVEELLFRGTAVLVANFTVGLLPIEIGTWRLVLLLVANGIWAGYHYHSFGAVVFTFVLGLFFTRFWLEGFSGLWWIAVLIHSAHNLWVISASQFFSPQPDPRQG